MIAVDVDDPIELHAAGIRVLNEQLGADVADRFIEQYFEGWGDYTAEKKLRPPMSDAEYGALLEECKAESIAVGVWE